MAEGGQCFWVTLGRSQIGRCFSISWNSWDADEPQMELRMEIMGHFQTLNDLTENPRNFGWAPPFNQAKIACALCGARHFTECSKRKTVSAGRPLYAILLRAEDQDHLCRCEAVPWVMSAGKKSWWYQYCCQGIPQEFLKHNILKHDISTWTNSHVVFLMKEWMWASMNIICLAPRWISMIRPIICIFLKSFGHEIHKVSRTAKTSHAGPLLSMLKHVSLQVCLPDMI